MEVVSLVYAGAFSKSQYVLQLVIFYVASEKRLSASTGFVDTINCSVKLRVDETVFIMNSDRK